MNGEPHWRNHGDTDPRRARCLAEPDRVSILQTPRFRQRGGETGVRPRTWILIVRGNAPCANMRVDLVPVVYIRRPEYWEIELVGCLPGPTCLPQQKPFIEAQPLNGTLGTVGIEVVGATRRQKIVVS